MKNMLSRRDFISSVPAFPTLPHLARNLSSKARTDLPLVDYHVHLDQVVTLEKALELSQERGVKFGIEKEYDALWTAERMRQIIEAAVKHGVAIEINSRYRLPSLAFLKMARKTGARFSFGSNIHGPDVGKLDYCLEMAKELGLNRSALFMPPAPGKKPIQVRSFAPGVSSL